MAKNKALEMLQKSYNKNAQSSFSGSVHSSNAREGALRLMNTGTYESASNQLNKKNATEEDEYQKNRGGILGGVGYLAGKFGTSLMQSVEGAVDYVAGGLAELGGSIAYRHGYDKAWNYLDNKAEKIIANDWFNYNAADDWYNPGEGWKVAGDVASGVGQSAFGIGIGALTANPALGLAAFGLSAGGMYTKEAYQETGNLGAKEFGYGTLMGAVELGTEALTGSFARTIKTVGRAFGKTAVKNAAKKTASLTVKSMAKRAAQEFASEAIEEMVAEIASPYVKRLTYDPNAKNATAAQVAYAGLVGGLAGTVMSGTGGAVAHVKYNLDGNQLVKNNKANQVISLAETMLSENGDAGSKNAIKELYDRLSPAVASGQKLNANQRRALGELRAYETQELMNPYLKRSAAGIIKNAETIAQRLNADGRYKIADGTLIFVENGSAFDDAKEVRDITAEDITKGIDAEGATLEKTLQKNDVLRYLTATDVASRIMLNAKNEANRLIFGNEVVSREDLTKRTAKLSDQQKSALAAELGIANLDTVTAEEFNQKANAFVESGKADTLARKIEVIDQMKELSQIKAKSIPRTIALSDGAMARYADSESDIAIARMGDEFMIYDYASGEVTRNMSRAEVNVALAKYRLTHQIAEANQTFVEKRALDEAKEAKRAANTAVAVDSYDRMMTMRQKQDAQNLADYDVYMEKETKRKAEKEARVLDQYDAHMAEKAVKEAEFTMKSIDLYEKYLEMEKAKEESEVAEYESHLEARKDMEEQFEKDTLDLYERYIEKQQERAERDERAFRKVVEEFAGNVTDSVENPDARLSLDENVINPNMVFALDENDVASLRKQAEKYREKAEKLLDKSEDVIDKGEERFNNANYRADQKKHKRIARLNRLSNFRGNVANLVYYYYHDKAYNTAEKVSRKSERINKAYDKAKENHRISEEKSGYLQLLRKQSDESISKEQSKIYEAERRAAQIADDVEFAAQLEDWRVKQKTEAVVKKAERQKDRASNALDRAHKKSERLEKESKRLERKADKLDKKADKAESKAKNQGSTMRYALGDEDVASFLQNENTNSIVVTDQHALSLARENVSEFDHLSESQQATVAETIRGALESGISEKNAITYARVSARSGLEIVFDEKSCLAGYDSNGNPVYAKGGYDTVTNKIFINPNKEGSNHSAVLIHELSHALRSYVGKDGVVHFRADKNARISDDLWKMIEHRYRNIHTNVSRDELIADEAIAKYTEDLLGTNEALELLVGNKPTLKQKILAFFRKAKADYASDTALSKEAITYLKSFKKMFDAFAEKNKNITPNVAKESGAISDIHFSLEFADNIAQRQRMKFSTKSDKVNLTQRELDLAIDMTASMVNVMNDHKDILPSDKVGKTLVKNGSYDYSVENTTVCLRTLSYNSFVDMVSEKIGRPLTQMESFLVSQKLYDIAKEPQCLYCYVSLDRKAYNDMILRYLNERDAAISAYEAAGKPSVSRTSKLYKDFLRNRSDTDNMWDRYNGWIAAYNNGEKLITANDVATEAKRSALFNKGTASEARQIKDMLKYAQSASWAKKQTQYAAYNSEILNLNERIVQNLNKHYGLRWYSFSDYSGAFIVENMQQITDASIRGLKGLSYTKDTDYAKIFAPTGMNINISVYATKDGKGGYAIDPKQSANIDEAIALRKKYPNVGIVVVATDNAGVEWALNQPWSDVVIPFHTVRTGQQVAEYYDWTVFNEEQNDTIQDSNMWKQYVDSIAKGNDKAAKKVSKMVYPSEHQNNKETYLRLIRERGLKPRFSSFLNNPNYMKLVNETRQSDAQTKALKPTFDMDSAKQSFDKFVKKGGYYEGWYNDGIDVDNEAEIVASDIRAGKKANEVSYGRQDRKGNALPSPQDILAARKITRSHQSGTKHFSLDEAEAEIIVAEDNIKASGESIVMDLKEKYSPSISNRFQQAITNLQIDLTNQQAGLEKELKRNGVKNAESMVQTIRSAGNSAQSMIGNEQYRVGAKSDEDMVYQGKGLSAIFEQISEEKKKDFFVYLFHNHHIDRMSLEEKSIERLSEEDKAAYKKWKLKSERIAELYEMIKDLSEKINSKNADERTDVRKKISEYRKEISSLARDVKYLDESVKNMPIRENKPVIGHAVDSDGKTLVTTAEDADVVPYTREESAQIIKTLEAQNPEFKSVAEEVWAYSKNLNQYRVDTGLISKEQFDYVQSLYPHYVPTYREGAKVGIAAIAGKYDLAVKGGLKTAKGSTRALLRPDVIIARQTVETIKAGRINQLANVLYNSAVENDSPNVSVVSKEKASNSNIVEDPTTIRPKDNSVTFFKDGERYTMKVTKDIFAGFDEFNTQTALPSAVEDVMKKVNKVFKNLITSYNPIFLLRNAARDAQDAGLYTEGKLGTFYNNYRKAFKEVLSNSELWQTYRAKGGLSTSLFDFERGYGKTQGKRGFENSSGVLGKTLGTIENANAFVEQLPRFAEFMTAVNAGKTYDEAILAATNVTTNFGRGGRLVKKMNSTLIPFLNPAIQGFSNTVKNVGKAFETKDVVAVSKAVGKLLFRIGLLGIIPMAINNFMYRDDEEYENLKNEDKENNYLIKIGNNFLKIPKGRILTMWAGLENRIERSIKGDENAFKGYVQNVLTNATPVDAMTRNFFSAWGDVRSNTTWYGSSIEGRELENLPVKERYDESTSSIAIAISKALPSSWGASPKMVHYLIDQYAGIIGDVLLPLTTKKAERDFISGNMTIDPALSNKLSGQFYDMYDAATQAKNSKEVSDEERELAAVRVKYLNQFKTTISDMYDQKSEIQKSDLSNSEKKTQTRAIQLLINETFKAALADVDEFVEKYSKTSNLGMDDIYSNYVASDISLETYEKLRFTEAWRQMYGSMSALSYFNKSVLERADELSYAGISVDDFYDYYFIVSGLSSDYDEDGEAIPGSKRAKVLDVINAIPIDARKKLLLIAYSGYSLQPGDVRGVRRGTEEQVLLSYLNSLSVSDDMLISIAERCGYSVDDDGKIHK